jgi:hypothetical protein
MNEKLTVGNLELCDLPELGIKGLHVRVDTGAATSSLHVDNIEEIDIGDSLRGENSRPTQGEKFYSDKSTALCH